MYLKRMGVESFIDRASVLWEELPEDFKRVYGYRPTESEIQSWKQSLPELGRVLATVSDASKTCEIFIEYGMPGNSCRSDVILVGRDAHGYRAAVIIELKQWDARSISIDGHNVRIAGQIHSHPSQQAMDYSDYLADLIPILQINFPRDKELHKWFSAVLGPCRRVAKRLVRRREGLHSRDSGDCSNNGF